MEKGDMNKIEDKTSKEILPEEDRLTEKEIIQLGKYSLHATYCHALEASEKRVEEIGDSNLEFQNKIERLESENSELRRKLKEAETLLSNQAKVNAELFQDNKRLKGLINKAYFAGEEDKTGLIPYWEQFKKENNI